MQIRECLLFYVSPSLDLCRAEITGLSRGVEGDYSCGIKRLSCWPRERQAENSGWEERQHDILSNRGSS